MARLCVVYYSLSAYFLIFLRIASVSARDDYHFYNTDTGRNSEHLLMIDTLDKQEEHRLQKRNVENNQSNPSTTPRPNSTFKPNETVVLPNQSPNVTNSVPLVNKTVIENKISSKTKLGKIVKVAPLTNVSQPSLDKSKLHVSATDHSDNRTFSKPSEETNHTLSNSTLNSFLDSSETAIDDLIDNENETKFNKTLVEHNITATEDTHMYYNSTVQTDPERGRYYWVDLNNRSDSKIHWLLSQSHRRAATVQLSFEFPFYGHLIRNITIATGGFLFTGDYVHSWLAATQYIAPLMANFDTSITQDSRIRYIDNGTSFTVEWEKVALHYKPDDGEFTFQTTLHKNGDIVFVYQNVPLFITNIDDDHHPVKVGLSDAYIIDRQVFLIRRKTIYEYHRVNFLKEEIKNWTVIYLKALPTCLQYEDCRSCATSHLVSFDCFWCPGINRCSSGVDRNRQDWLAKGCEKRHIDNETKCSHISGNEIFDEHNMTYSHDSSKFQQRLEGSAHPVKMGVSSIVAILFLTAMVCGLAFWILYAYRNPHTTSGQILIRYRPSQWRWRRGEARYTAATIHM